MAPAWKKRKIAGALLFAALFTQFAVGISSPELQAAQNGVPTFAGNAQHTAIYQPAAQPLNTIRWSTTIDFNDTTFAHYAGPLITPANTVLVPIKTSTNGFQITAFNGADGSMKYTLSTDYILPSYQWIPTYNPVLATYLDGNQVSHTRLYYAGAGGTMYYIENPDSNTPGTPVQEVFYTNLSTYQAQASSFNSTVFINTPITADTNGNIFFGFRVQGTAPAPLSTTQSGFARIDPNGIATYVLAGTAAADGNIGYDSHNSAPALSQDQSTLYVVVKSSTEYYGYLLGLDATSLATKYKVFLTDPRNGSPAGIRDISTASPTVAPDNDVYFGVFSNPDNGSRGFLLRFSGDLTVEKTPGGFGWDYTAAIVPASMVPSYTGASPYLIFSKYNNYAEVDGDGVNKIALLDPNATQIDPHSTANGLVEMREVLTVIGPTPDPENFSSQYPNAVREWCINTAAVNPATNSIFTPSEDGHIYRWNLATNSLDQAVTLGPGVGDPYVPTVIGPDGTVYTLNGGSLFALGSLNGVGVALTSSTPDVRTVVVGQSLTFTAAVTNTGSSGITPTGTVTFQDVSFQGMTPITSTLASVSLDSSGHAAYSTSSLPAGGNFITAVYSGDSSFSSGSAMLVEEIHAYATTTTLTASPNPSNVGQPVSLTAGVSPGVSGAGTPTGMVTFEEGTTVLGQVGVNSGGTASFSTAALNPGSDPVTAIYYSDSLNAASVSAPLTEMVATNPATATLISSDTATQGNWQGKYGVDGYFIANGPQSNSLSYGTFVPQNPSNWTWAASTTDPRALAIPGGSGGVASCWYSGSTFSLDVNITDGNSHQMALYALDWDNAARAETIQIVDGNNPGTVLSTQSVSGFSGGTYLVWTISGHVKINVTQGAGPNAVISGVFFGSAGPTAPLITSTNSTAFTVGMPGTFTVTASGFPAPTLGETGTLPSGVTFNATTGVLSGTPAAGTNGSYPLMFTASNSAGANTQNFTLSVNQASSTTATFVGPDTTTQGNWQGKYGVDGYFIANGPQSDSLSYGTFVPQNPSNWTWAASTTDPRALAIPGGSGDVASCWYSGSTFSLDVNITDGDSHQMALYALDWDNAARAETVQIVDGNNPSTVLSTQSVSDFSGGTYLVWTISGHVKINVTQTAGPNAVISGVFFGSAGPTAPLITSTNSTAFTVGMPGTFTVTASGFPAPTLGETGTLPSGVTFNATTGVLSGTPAAGTNGSYPLMLTASNSAGANTQNFTLSVNQASSTTATFVGPDTTTQGNWQGKYGVDGYFIANGPQSDSLSYGTFVPQNPSNWTWAASTTDPRALAIPGGSGGVASCWYSGSTFSLDVNITDGNSHQMALYVLDWDNAARAETIQIVDGNNPSTVLSTQSVSGFSGGTYLIWTISGHVKINVTQTAGLNAVISGVFFGSASSTTAATAAFVGSDTTTQGNWQGKYGVNGYFIGNTNYQSPAGYAALTPRNQLSWTWAASTTDPRALAIPGGSGGVASCWYSGSTFSFDVNITDGNSHQVALYALDWDSAGRAETIQIVDGNNPGTVLTTQSVSGFSGGTYLIWTISGHVTINVTQTAGVNAVISGVFFK